MAHSWRANREDLGGKPGTRGGHGTDRRHKPREVIADTLAGFDVVAATVLQHVPSEVDSDEPSQGQSVAA